MDLVGLKTQARRGNAEGGFAGGAEVLVTGVLIFVLATIVVINLWSVIDAKAAVTAASREAARIAVESSNSDGIANARAAALEAVRRRHDLNLGTDGTDGIAIDSGGFGRCARATVTVSARVTLMAVPHWGILPSTVRVTSTHSELIDPYRSGLGGEALCSRSQSQSGPDRRGQEPGDA